MTEPLDELDAEFQVALEHGGEISRRAAAAITKAGIHNARELIAFGRDNLYLEPDIGKWDVVTVDMWLKRHAPALYPRLAARRAQLIRYDILGAQPARVGSGDLPFSGVLWPSVQWRQCFRGTFLVRSFLPAP